MTPIIALVAFTAAVIGGGMYLAGLARARRVAAERLSLPDVEERVQPTVRHQVFARRHYVLPWIVAVAVAVILIVMVGLPPLYAVAFAVIVGLLGGQVDGMLLARKQDRIEVQLADAIDLIVSALGVGATLQSALENALRDMRSPLRPELEDVVVRWRYGDEPAVVLGSLAHRVPLETFRLFATSLAVNHEVGGSLVQTLASVGRTIRNRIEITRRLRALTMQGRVSVAAILIVTYGLAAIMWRNEPDRMAGFLLSTVGQWLVAIAMVLQGLGIVWIAALCRPKF